MHPVRSPASSAAVGLRLCGRRLSVATHVPEDSPRAQATAFGKAFHEGAADAGLAASLRLYGFHRAGHREPMAVEACSIKTHDRKVPPRSVLALDGVSGIAIRTLAHSIQSSEMPAECWASGLSAPSCPRQAAPCPRRIGLARCGPSHSIELWLPPPGFRTRTIPRSYAGGTGRRGPSTRRRSPTMRCPTVTRRSGRTRSR